MGWGWSHPNLDCTHGFFIRAALRFWTAAKAASFRKEQLIFLEKNGLSLLRNIRVTTPGDLMGIPVPYH